MRIPTEKKRPFVPRRGKGEDEGDIPGQAIPRSRSVADDDGENELIACTGCKTQNVVHVSEDLTKRPCIHCGEVLADAHRTKIATVFDKVTGIRKRTRQRLGYRRALSEFELQIDPNLHLEGERLRRAMEQWLFENHTPWDSANPRRKATWLDNPAARMTLVGVAAIVLVAGVLSLQRVKSDSPEFQPAEPLPSIDPAAVREIAKSEFDLAKPVIYYFLAADSTRRLLSVVRDRERIRPLMEAYYQEKPPVPIEHVDLQLVDAANYAGRVFLRVQAELPDGRFAGLTLERGRSHYLVDWESFVGHSEISWSKFKDSVPYNGEVVRLRAYASIVPHYLPPFDDEQKYQSIWLQSQDGEQLVGYIERLSPQLIDLRLRMDDIGRKKHEVIVRVRYPDSEWSKNEVEIVEIVQTGWVEWDRQPALATTAATP